MTLTGTVWLISSGVCSSASSPFAFATAATTSWPRSSTSAARSADAAFMVICMSFCTRRSNTSSELMASAARSKILRSSIQRAPSIGT
jgi:hypothetical protein